MFKWCEESEINVLVQNPTEKNVQQIYKHMGTTEDFVTKSIMPRRRKLPLSCWSG